MRDGRIVARKFTGYFDCGAYTRLSSYAIIKGVGHLPGPYTIPNVYADVYCVFTNRTPATAMRGFGITGVDFAIEAHMDKVARGGRHGPDRAAHPQRLPRRRHEGAPPARQEHRADRMLPGRGREGEMAARPARRSPPLVASRRRRANAPTCPAHHRHRRGRARPGLHRAATQPDARAPAARGRMPGAGRPSPCAPTPPPRASRARAYSPRRRAQAPPPRRPRRRRRRAPTSAARPLLLDLRPQEALTWPSTAAAASPRSTTRSA